MRHKFRDGDMIVDSGADRAQGPYISALFITVRNEVEKVMFLQASVCPRGGLPTPPEQTPLGSDTSRPGTPPLDQVQPPGPGTHPLEQTHPPGPGVPPNRHPPDQVYPPEQTPPGTRYIPPDQVHPPDMATAADGTHPTGMHSCFIKRWPLIIHV